MPLYLPFSLPKQAKVKKWQVFILVSIISIWRITPLFSEDRFGRWNQYFIEAEKSFLEGQYETSIYYNQKAYNAISKLKLNDKEIDLKRYTYDKILKRLGDCYLRLGREYEAVEYYKKSLGYRGAQATLLEFLGKFYIDIHDFTEATTYLDQYHQKVSKTNLEIRLLLAYSLAKQNDRDRAKNIIREAERIDADNLQDNEIPKECDEMEKKGLYVEAIECYNLILLKQPYTVELYHHLIRIAQKIKSKKGMRYLIKYAEYLYLFYGDDEKNIWTYFFALYNDQRYKQAKGVLTKLKEITAKKRMVQALERQINYEQGR